jgi:hypothetical protein
MVPPSHDCVIVGPCLFEATCEGWQGFGAPGIPDDATYSGGTETAYPQ